MTKFTVKNFTADPTKEPERSPVGGYLVLGLILVVCVITAIFLSNMISRQFPPVEDIVLMPEGQNLAQSQETVDDQSDVPDDPAASSVDLIEETNAQTRGLASINDAISSYRLVEGQYPEYISDVINRPGFDIPENRFLSGTPVQHVNPGDFYPGGFSYLPYDYDDEDISGYILVSYAGTEEAGITIENPEEIILPGNFRPSIGVPLIGVAIVMLEGGDIVDLSEYR